MIEDDPYWNLYYPSARAISEKYRGPPDSNDFSTSPDHNCSTQDLEGRSTGHRFLDQLIPSFLSIDVDGRVIRLDSFSKTIAPGCRLGWITAQPSICEQLFRVTDGTSQQPSGFVQAIVTQLLGEFETDSSAPGTAGWGLEGWVRWLEGLRSTYERRMMLMATLLEENRFTKTGQTEMFTFSWPMGGMFIWLEVNIFNHPLVKSVDPKRLMFALWIFCTQPPYQVLIVPGGDFAASEAVKEANGYRFLRFCFSAVEEAVLKDKSRSFIKACRNFWAICDAKDIDYILRDEDAARISDKAAKAAGELDREILEEW